MTTLSSPVTNTDSRDHDPSYSNYIYSRKPNMKPRLDESSNTEISLTKEVDESTPIPDAISIPEEMLDSNPS